MNDTHEDYLAEVLKGNCGTYKISKNGPIKSTISYEQWKATKHAQQKMRDILEVRLCRPKN